MVCYKANFNKFQIIDMIRLFSLPTILPNYKSITKTQLEIPDIVTDHKKFLIQGSNMQPNGNNKNLKITGVLFTQQNYIQFKNRKTWLDT